MRRLIDCVLATAALVVAAVPMGLTALAIKLSSPGPVIYRQTRIGRGGAPFVLYKLRTMSPSTGGPQVTAAADKRISPVGAVLRKLKIDELPQLWNVLRGDMTIIGARPEVPHFVAHYTPEQRQILESKPGLASLAQLVYPHESAMLRDHPDPEDAYVRHLMPAKIAVDLQYERTRTAWSDCRLIVEMVLLIAGVQLRADRALRLPATDAIRSGR